MAIYCTTWSICIVLAVGSRRRFEERIGRQFRIGDRRSDAADGRLLRQTAAQSHEGRRHRRGNAGRGPLLQKQRGNYANRCCVRRRCVWDQSLLHSRLFIVIRIMHYNWFMNIIFILECSAYGNSLEADINGDTSGPLNRLLVMTVKVRTPILIINNKRNQFLKKKKFEKKFNFWKQNLEKI